MTPEEYILYAVIAAALLTAAVIVGTCGRGGKRVEGNKPEPAPRGDMSIGDKALAQLFYHEFRKALNEGRIRPALVSDECPQGTIAYDFARQDWICVEKDGATHPLGQPPAGEQLEIEDYGVGEE